MNRRISTEVHEHNLLKASPALGAARSSRRGRRARRGGCRVVTLSPSFMPPSAFMPPFMPRLLTRVPPLLSDLVSCDTGRRRCRRDIRRCRRHAGAAIGGGAGGVAAAAGFWLHAATSAKADAIISGLANLTNALSFRVATTLIRIAWPSFNQKGRSFPVTASLRRPASRWRPFLPGCSSASRSSRAT